MEENNNLYNKKANVILDTNFLVDLFRFKLGFDDIEKVVGKRCRFLVVQQSLRELGRIKDKYAKVGLGFVDREKIKVIDAPGVTADDAIISLVSKESFVVATNDTKLRKKLKSLKARIIYLRAKKYLEITN